ncbi:MAG: carboxypeptidase-like regulatory domain-containing protein [Deltaproteobacteria bacterium]|nr:carboxypeptidase-like regulatory domain-containing protein [Deltaproteobacteria bacterium]
MPGSFSLLTLAQPQNVQATLLEGGNLAPNTTYYFKIVAGKYFESGTCRCHALSPRSATVQVTTTDVNKKVQLNCDPVSGANRYYVLVSTANNFGDKELVCLSNANGYIWKPLSLPYVYDNASAYKGLMPDFVQGLPILFVWGGTEASPVTMWDLYQADLSGGWGIIRPALIDGKINFNSEKQESTSWLVHANIVIGSNGTSNQTAYFRSKYAGALIIYGTFTATSLATLVFGDKNNVKDAHMGRLFTIVGHGTYDMASTILGKIKGYGLRTIRGGETWDGRTGGWGDNYYPPSFYFSADSEMLECDFGYGEWVFTEGAGIPIEGCRFAGLFPYLEGLSKPKVTMTPGINFSYWKADGKTVREPVVTHSTQDLRWGTQYVGTIIDGTFLSHQQTDNKPWIQLLQYPLQLGGHFTFKNTLVLRVSDQGNGPLAGAQVTIKDSGGNTVASGLTDENGKFNAGEITSRVLWPTEAVVGQQSIGPYHEDEMVSRGYLTRGLHTPHTLTIEKAGYQTYRDILDINRKMDLDIALSPYAPANPLTVEIEMGAKLEVALEISPNIEVELS